MFKLLLCIIIITTSGALGILKSQTYSQRVKELSDLREMLMMIQTDISYMKDPLPVIFRRVGECKHNVATEILKNCSIFMEDKHDMQYCWTTAVDMSVRNNCLTQEDKAVIYDLGTQLGRTNVKGQTELIRMTDEKLSYQLKEAEHDRKSKGRMYAGMGFSIGTVIAVLFI